MNMKNPMQMPERVQFEETGSPFVGRFILQPLEEGYGVTVGNAMRRVLLSSIPGAAIVGVKISNVQHEFQTIPGVVEDMTEIILNLKEVGLKLIDTKATRITFRLSGAREWTAGDIQNASSSVEVLDPTHHIATLAEDADFDVELRIGRGNGYVPSEENASPDYPVGMIPIDAIFTPIKNVVFNVEPFRVGQKTDYERLSLDVKTNGSITALEATQIAGQILQEHVNLFVGYQEAKKQAEGKDKAEDELKEQERMKTRRALELPVDELELSVRAHNCLKAAQIKYMKELVRLHESDLLKFRNFGRKSLAEISDVVKLYNLEFGMDVDKYLKDEPSKALLS